MQLLLVCCLHPSILSKHTDDVFRIHVCVTYTMTGHEDEFVADLNEAVEAVKRDPDVRFSLRQVSCQLLPFLVIITKHCDTAVILLVISHFVSGFSLSKPLFLSQQ